jgi:hypothetical protein
MRKRVLGVLLCASLMVGALPGLALADPPTQTPPAGTPGPPEDFFTVVCPNPGQSPNLFIQTLPSTSQHGSEMSLEHSAGGEECFTI